MKSPDPKVMRAVFNDPKALKQLTSILSEKDSSQKNTITINNKEYIVRTSSTINKLKDL